MALTIAQLTSLLESLPAPACIHDANGAVVAQNEAARDQCPGNCDKAPSHTLDLGDGWVLRFADLRKHKRLTASSGGQAKSPRPNEHLADVHALARGIAHEIRNPLSSILTAISLVRDDPSLSEENGVLLDVIKKEAHRMKRILEEFSLYVKPPTPQPVDFDLVEVIRHVVATLQREGVLGAAIKVTDKLPPTLMARGDETQIAQVLEQVLTNAVDTMPERGVIGLSAHQESSYVILCIEDSGPGFSTESLQRAFQPFYSKKSQSTGLGLSIAHAAVEAAGGRIWLENIVAGSVASKSPPPPGLAAPLPTKAGTLPSAVQGARVCIELPTTPLTT